MQVTFTDRELDVMAVLWAEGASTVADVRDRLDDPLAYTTVLSVLRTLEAKGYVGHVEEGRAHRYHALVDRDVAGRSALRRLLDTVFGHSPELLLGLVIGAAGLGNSLGIGLGTVIRKVRPEAAVIGSLLVDAAVVGRAAGRADSKGRRTRPRRVGRGARSGPRRL